MGRPRVDRKATIASVSLAPHEIDFLREHGISPTKAVKAWIDDLITCGESTLIEDRIVRLERELESWRRKLELVKARERRTAEIDKRRKGWDERTHSNR